MQRFDKRYLLKCNIINGCLALLTGLTVLPARGSAASPADKVPRSMQAQVPPDAQRAFARTAKPGQCTIEALKESGEHGGGLTPTTEDTSRFTREGNEAFGACMTLWNQHRWAEARELA